MTDFSDEETVSGRVVRKELEGCEPTHRKNRHGFKSQNARGLTGLASPASTCTPIHVNCSMPGQCPDLHDLLRVYREGYQNSQAKGTVLRCLRR